MSSLGSIGDILVGVTADLTELKNSLSQAVVEMRQAGDQMTQAMQAGLKPLESGGAIEGFSKNLKTAQETMQEWGAVALKTGVALEGLTLPLQTCGLEALETAGKFEQAEVAFGTMLGSATLAKDFLSSLIDFAAKTPFEIEPLIDGSRRLLAMGYKLQELIPMMRVLGDAVAGLGLGQAGINRLTLAFGEMRTRGTVALKELNQLAMAGIPGVEILAEKMGKTVQEVFDMTRKKMMQSAEAIPLLLEGINEKFGGMMEKQSKTLLGMWSNVKDNITKTLLAIGNELLPAAKIFVEFANTILAKIRELAQWFGTLPEPIKNFAMALGVLAVVIPPLLIAAGGLALALGAISAPIAAAAAGLAVLTAAAVAIATAFRDEWPGIKAVILQIASALSESLASAWTPFQEAVSKVWDVLKTAAKEAAPLLTTELKLLAATILAVITAAAELVGGLAKLSSAMKEAQSTAASQTWEGIKIGWNDAKSFLLNCWENIQQGGLQFKASQMSAFDGMWSGIAEAARSAWGPLGDWLIGVWRSISAEASSIWAGVKSVIGEHWNAIKDMAQKTWGWIVEQINSFIEVCKKIPGVAKLFKLNEVYDEANKTAKATAQLAADMKLLGISAESAAEQLKKFANANPRVAWVEDHVKTVLAMRDAYARAQIAFKEGKISADQLEAAHKKLLDTEKQVPPATINMAGAHGQLAGAQERSAKASREMQTEHKKVDALMQQIGTAIRDAKTDYDAWSEAIQKKLDVKEISLGPELDAANKQIDKMIKLVVEARDRWGSLSDAQKKSVEHLEQIIKKMQDNALRKAEEQLAQAFKDNYEGAVALGKTMDNIPKAFSASTKEANLLVKEIGAAAEKAVLIKDPLQQTAELEKELGIELSKKFAVMADSAEAAYNRVKSMSQEEKARIGITAADETKIWIAAAEARIKADEAAGRHVDESLKIAVEHAKERLTDLGTAHDKILDGISRAWDNLTKSMKNAFTKDLSDNLAKAIVHMKGFHDVMTSLLQSITKAFISFAEEALKSILETVAKKAFGGLINALTDTNLKFVDLSKNIAKTATELGGNAASGAAGSAGKGAAGIAAGAGGLIGSIASITSIVGSIASVITGIVQIFQNMRMENTLNAIEGNTRECSIGINRDIIARLWDLLRVIQVDQFARLDNIAIGVSQFGAILNDQLMFQLWPQLASKLDDIKKLLGTGGDGGGGGGIDMTGVTDRLDTINLTLLHQFPITNHVIGENAAGLANLIGKYLFDLWKNLNNSLGALLNSIQSGLGLLVQTLTMFTLKPVPWEPVTSSWSGSSLSMLDNSNSTTNNNQRNTQLNLNVTAVDPDAKKIAQRIVKELAAAGVHL